MAVTVREFVNDFSSLVSWLRGPQDTLISNIGSPVTAQAESVVFIPDEKHLRQALECRARVLVVHSKLISKISESENRTILASPNVQLVMALAARKYFPVTSHHTPVDGHRIHPSAHISKTAELGRDVKVGPGAVIGDHCQVGDGAIIGANSVLEPRVKVGPRTHIHPLVFIAHDCEIGADCEIKPHSTIGGEGFGYAHDSTGQHHRITHYGRVLIEDRVHIGANVQVDRGTYEDSRIGAGTKIDNHCHFGHNIVIGKNTLIAGGMITAGSARLGSDSMFGGRTTVGGHFELPDKIQVAGVSVISKPVDGPGAYGGYPIQPMPGYLKTLSSLPSLPKMRKQMGLIMKKLGLETDEE